MCHSCYIHSPSNTPQLCVFGVSRLFHKFRIILHRLKQKAFATIVSIFILFTVSHVLCVMHIHFSLCLSFFFSNFFSILLLCVSLATDQTNIKISIEQTNSVNLIFFFTKSRKNIRNKYFKCTILFFCLLTKSMENGNIFSEYLQFQYLAGRQHLCHCYAKQFQ